MSDLQVYGQPRVYIVVLNWNGWEDTIECLESVFRLSYSRFTVIVCDNASSDGSMEKIEGWAKGFIPASCDNADLAHLTVPSIPKPLGFDYIFSSEDGATSLSSGSRLLLIHTGANLGFAGGNNVGIRYALARGDCDYVWLLNNDTVVEPDSLSAMVQMAEADPKLGICGSQLRSYTRPHEIQTMGGRRYSRWSGRTRPLQDPSTPRVSTTPGAPDYIEGASMLISRRCLEAVGLLEESYFLYYEELDLVGRVQPAFKFGYSAASVVYHKEGASIGTASIRANRSAVSEFYLARNRIVFTKRYHAWFLPSVLAVTGLSALQRIVIGRPKNATAIIRGALASFRYLKPPQAET
jgi:GT2 family glycosyltransferase